MWCKRWDWVVARETIGVCSSPSGVGSANNNREGEGEGEGTDRLGVEEEDFDPLGLRDCFVDVGLGRFEDVHWRRDDDEQEEKERGR